jgi:hypothetical protein
MSTVYLDVTPRSLVVRYRHFSGIFFFISEDIELFYSEDKGSIFIRNVGVHPPYMTSSSRRQSGSYVLGSLMSVIFEAGRSLSGAQFI